MRVLIIEDDPDVAGMLVMVLEVEGFDVDLAVDGEQGLELAQRSPPDVIVLDVMMPNVDGWAVAEALKQSPHLASVPVVFCTAKADAEATWRGWRLGAASYITKPFDNEELISELLRVTRPVTAPGAPVQTHAPAERSCQALAPDSPSPLH